MIALVQVVLSRMGVVWPQYVGVYEPRIVVIEKVERIFRLPLDSYFLYSLFAGIQQNKFVVLLVQNERILCVLIVLLFRRCATSHLWPFKHGCLSLRTAPLSESETGAPSSEVAPYPHALTFGDAASKKEA